MTIKEYEKNYGKAYVEVTSYNKVKIISKETKTAEKLTIEDLKKPLNNIGITDYKLKILEERGVKFTRKNVLEVFTKTESNMIFWLEKGSKSRGGMEHILYKHGLELRKLGIKEEEITNVIGNLLKSKPMYRLIDSRGPNMIYRFGEKYLLLAYGTNGFIVSFYSLRTENDLRRMLSKAIQIIKLD